MLSEFVVVSFAAFIGYQAFRTWFSFIPMNALVAPLLVFGFSFLFTLLSQPSVLVAVAATGGVALLNKITDVVPPEPARFPVRIPRRQRTISREAPGRIPSL